MSRGLGRAFHEGNELQPLGLSKNTVTTVRMECGHVRTVKGPVALAYCVPCGERRAVAEIIG